MCFWDSPRTACHQNKSGPETGLLQTTVRAGQGRVTTRPDGLPRRVGGGSRPAPTGGAPTVRTLPSLLRPGYKGVYDHFYEDVTD